MTVEELLVLVDVSPYVGRTCRFCLNDIGFRSHQRAGQLTGHHDSCPMLHPVDPARLLAALNTAAEAGG